MGPSSSLYVSYSSMLNGSGESLTPLEPFHNELSYNMSLFAEAVLQVTKVGEHPDPGTWDTHIHLLSPSLLPVRQLLSTTFLATQIT